MKICQFLDLKVGTCKTFFCYGLYNAWSGDVALVNGNFKIALDNCDIEWVLIQQGIFLTIF